MSKEDKPREGHCARCPSHVERTIEIGSALGGSVQSRDVVAFGSSWRARAGGEGIVVLAAYVAS